MPSRRTPPNGLTSTETALVTTTTTRIGTTEVRFGRVSTSKSSATTTAVRPSRGTPQSWASWDASTTTATVTTTTTMLSHATARSGRTRTGTATATTRTGSRPMRVRRLPGTPPWTALVVRTTTAMDGRIPLTASALTQRLRTQPNGATRTVTSGTTTQTATSLMNARTHRLPLVQPPAWRASTGTVAQTPISTVTPTLTRPTTRPWEPTRVLKTDTTPPSPRPWTASVAWIPTVTATPTPMHRGR